jgi:hypothetical protein
MVSVPVKESITGFDHGTWGEIDFIEHVENIVVDLANEPAHGIDVEIARETDGKVVVTLEIRFRVRHEGKAFKATLAHHRRKVDLIFFLPVGVLAPGFRLPNPIHVLAWVHGVMNRHDLPAARMIENTDGG